MVQKKWTQSAFLEKGRIADRVQKTWSRKNELGLEGGRAMTASWNKSQTLPGPLNRTRPAPTVSTSTFPTIVDGQRAWDRRRGKEGERQSARDRGRGKEGKSKRVRDRGSEIEVERQRAREREREIEGERQRV